MIKITRWQTAAETNRRDQVGGLLKKKHPAVCEVLRLRNGVNS
ncbi:hypothetical protein HPTD01_2378 [Halomonas sp. TD01]|nr:hypothetical protein HPTD01_2378 [Halomonas sp. TD01]